MCADYTAVIKSSRKGGCLIQMSKVHLGDSIAWNFTLAANWIRERRSNGSLLREAEHQITVAILCKQPRNRIQWMTRLEAVPWNWYSVSPLFRHFPIYVVSRYLSGFHSAWRDERGITWLVNWHFRWLFKMMPQKIFFRCRIINSLLEVIKASFIVANLLEVFASVSSLRLWSLLFSCTNQRSCRFVSGQLIAVINVTLQVFPEVNNCPEVWFVDTFI